MKTSNIYSSGIAKSGACIIATLGLSLASGFAATNSVEIPLGGTQVGPGLVVNVSSTTRLNAAANYTYTISGTCHTTGSFTGALVNGTSINSFMNAATRTGSYANLGGTNSFIAVNRNFSKTVSITSPLPFSVTMKAHLRIKVTSGKVNLLINNFTQNSGFPINGSVFFEQGSKMVISVVP